MSEKHSRQFRARHRGRGAQIFIDLGKLLRMFIYQNDWKVLPMAALIAGLVGMVIRKRLFITMEGTLMGAFAMVMVCIWNGCFNSIQVICRERVNEVMDIFGLTPVKDNLVEKLSGGQKKRLSISLEFISNPSLFILDEPDSGLDGVMARELFEQLRKIADTGKIVIVITHTPDRVIDLFDDVIVLAKDSARTGRLAWYGSIEDARKFFDRERMEQIVKSVNRKEEGGDGLADEFVTRYAEAQKVGGAA